MNIIKRYKLLMLFIIVMLVFMGSFIVFKQIQSPSHEKATGKIMISGISIV